MNPPFIDEKEWRYVPDDACIISGVQFEGTPRFSERADMNSELGYFIKMTENADKAKNEAPKYDNLKFEVNDITHIVVGQDSEIPEIIDHLNTIYGNAMPDKKLMLLYSKVTSYETLERDFFSH